MRNTGTRSLRRFALSLLAWTVLALYFFSQSLAQNLFFHDPTPWWHTLVSWFAGMYLWALLTPVILWLGRRFPIEKPTWPRRTAFHLLFGFGMSVLVLVLDSALLPRIGILPSILGSTFRSAFRVLVVIGFHGGVLTYWTVLGIQHGFRYYRGYQEREQQALRLELRASELQTQLMRAQLRTGYGVSHDLWYYF
jgi:hypothetical protein